VHLQRHLLSKVKLLTLTTASGISGSQHYVDGERLRDYNCKRRMGNIVQPGHKSSNFRNAARAALAAESQFA
jgi:hypothetical protein